jgi:hypothetical protein
MTQPSEIQPKGNENETLHLHASPLQLAKYLALCSGTLIFIAWYFLTRPSPLIVYVCAWVSGIGCIWVCGIIVIRALNIRQPLVTLSPVGILDVRVSTSAISWPSVKKISIGKVARRQEMLFLYVHSSSLAKLPLKRSIRFCMPLLLNRAQGHAKIGIGHQEFEMAFDKFAQLIQDYAQAQGVKLTERS